MLASPKITNATAFGSTLTGGLANTVNTEFSDVSGGCSNYAGTGTPPKLNNTCTTANTGYFASVLGVAIQESTTVWVYNDQTVDG
jgi:hypothetical protein